MEENSANAAASARSNDSEFQLSDSETEDEFLLKFECKKEYGIAEKSR